MNHPIAQFSTRPWPTLLVGQQNYASPTGGPAPPIGATLSDVLNAIWRRKWLLISSNLALCVIAFALIKNLPSLYTAVAKIAIDPRRQLAAEADPELAALRLNLDTIEALESEVEVIKSKYVLQEALDQAGPDPTAPTAPEPDMLCALVSWLPEAVASTVCADSVGPGDVGGPVEALRDYLEIKQIGLSSVVGIAYSHPDPGRAAGVASAIAAAYVAHQSKAREDAAQDAETSLRNRIPAARAELEQARQALESYRAEEALVGGDADLLHEQIAGLRLHIGELRAEHQALQSRIARAEALVQEKGPRGAFEVIAASEIAQEHKLELSRLLQRREELGRELGSSHPEMIALGQQIEAVQSQLEDTAAAEVLALVNEGELTARRLAAAEDQLAALRRDLASIAGAEIPLRSLEQEVNAKQATLDVLLERTQQFSDLGYSRPVAWIVNRADPPLEPDAPNRPLLFTVAATASLGLTLGLVLLLEMRERRYAVSLDTLKMRSDADALAILPINPIFHPQKKAGLAPRNRQAAGLYMEAMHRAYSSLVRPGPSPARIVLVSSAEPGEGKTTFTATLGRAAARRGKRVLLVDCDFLRPALHRRLGLSMIIDDLCLSPTILPLSVPGEDSLDLLTAAPVSKDFREEFYHQNISELLSQLTVDYDLLIVDTPPVLAVADAKILAPFADTVVLVVKWRSTSLAAVDAAIAELHESRKEPIKVVLNQVDLTQYASYSYNSYPTKAASYSYSQYYARD